MAPWKINWLLSQSKAIMPHGNFIPQQPLEPLPQPGPSSQRNLETAIPSSSASNDADGEMSDILESVESDSWSDDSEGSEESEEICEWKELYQATMAENSRLQERLNSLQESYVKAVDSVGTGLEPISDRSFERGMGELCDDINQWCRQVSRLNGQNEVCSFEKLPAVYATLHLSQRIGNVEDVKGPYLMETVIWACLEWHVFSQWLPGLSEKMEMHMRILEDRMRGGDTTEDKTRAQYWRAYTASLFFQDATFQNYLNDVDSEIGVLGEVSNILHHTPVRTTPAQITALRAHLRAAKRLAAELRCQRVTYDIDDRVFIGDAYDRSIMLDIEFQELPKDGKGKAIVKAIVSKGLVKRMVFGGHPVLISKTRVLLQL